MPSEELANFAGDHSPVPQDTLNSTFYAFLSNTTPLSRCSSLSTPLLEICGEFVGAFALGMGGSFPYCSLLSCTSLHFVMWVIDKLQSYVNGTFRKKMEARLFQELVI